MEETKISGEVKAGIMTVVFVPKNDLSLYDFVVVKSENSTTNSFCEIHHKKDVIINPILDPMANKLGVSIINLEGGKENFKDVFSLCFKPLESDTMEHIYIKGGTYKEVFDKYLN